MPNLMSQKSGLSLDALKTCNDCSFKWELHFKMSPEVKGRALHIKARLKVASS